mgnify:CR=1 FL=1
MNTLVIIMALCVGKAFPKVDRYNCYERAAAVLGVEHTCDIYDENCIVKEISKSLKED